MGAGFGDDWRVFAILSDIHGNRPALDAVMDEIAHLGIRRLMVLGDVIGYGPYPNDCLRAVQKAEICLLGNHEAGVIGTLDQQWFNDAAWAGVEWTRRKLTHADRTLIGQWKATGEHAGVQLAHGSLNPSDPFDYLLNPRALKIHFAVQKAPVCFVGHTHVPEVWTEGSDLPVVIPASGVFKLLKDRKMAVNVGSVGLPREDDRRASWATYDPDSGEVCLRKTKYDIKEMIRTVRHLNLDPVLQDKILKDLGA